MGIGEGTCKAHRLQPEVRRADSGMGFLGRGSKVSMKGQRAP